MNYINLIVKETYASVIKQLLHQLKPINFSSKNQVIKVGSNIKYAKYSCHISESTDYSSQTSFLIIEPQTWESGLCALLETLSSTYFDIGHWESEIRNSDAYLQIEKIVLRGTVGSELQQQLLKSFLSGFSLCKYNIHLHFLPRNMNSPVQELVNEAWRMRMESN